MKGKPFVLGLCLLFVSSMANAEESFRLPRSAPSDSPQYDPPAIAPSYRRPTDSARPIEGVVQRSEMQGNTEEVVPQRATAGHPIVGGVERSDMSAFADQSQMQQPILQRPMLGNLQNNAIQGQTAMDNHRPLTGGVTQIEIQKLGRHDIVLLIDKSSSMRTPDCPGTNQLMGTFMSFLGGMGGGGMGVSRWQWCGMQTMALAQQYATVAPTGLSVVLFSWSTRIFPHVAVSDIPKIFQTVRPDGATNEAAAVRETLEDYFTRKNITHGNVKPLLVAVITDGLPTNKDGVRRALIDASMRVQRPDEIKVTFLQVGTDPEGADFVQEMQHNLIYEGARYPIASSKTFRELERTGLTRALVDCISEQQR